MPLAKFKFIVSSSDSEQGYEAENLLVDGRTRTKWKGKAGAVNNCVVIQLDREHSITSVDIGNEFSALVEILVAKSCEQQPSFHTLVPSSSLMDPMESRSEKNGNRVRMFAEMDMIPAIYRQKWDLIKVLCSQPFNPNIPYGIAFVNIVVEEQHVGTSVETKNQLPKIVFKPKHEDGGDKMNEDGGDKMNEDGGDKMKAGDMFKQRHLYQTKEAEDMLSKQKNKNSEHKKRRSVSDDEDRKLKQTKENKLDQKRTENALSTKAVQDATPGPSTTLTEERDEAAESKKVVKRPVNAVNEKADAKHEETSTRTLKKGKITPSKPHETITSTTSKVPFNEVLTGVRFSLSGYQNPQRSQLRDKARQMGAIYEADWTPSCTHLICAFPNTPKWRQVGSSGIIVSEKWIEMCHQRKKRLPEKNFPVTLA
uniref:DNA repair protein XRCC1 n=1 Tax=Ascaris suum TaxID=6253 RepID=F1L600_ASCSU